MPVARCRVLAAAALGLAAALTLSACGSSGSGAVPTWTPQPSFAGDGVQPDNPQPVEPGQGGGGSTPPGSSTSPATPGKTIDPAVVATKLVTPTALAIMPDHSALVGERTTGKIVRVQPKAGRPVTTVRTLTGLSTTGGGGLLDLAVSPNYDEDNLLFAYITTPKDNRVVAFSLHGPVTTVIGGIPRGTSDNTGRIAFDQDGHLLIGTGDAGHPALANNPKSLAGKILRVTDIGRPVRTNPDPRSPVYASGLRRTDGLCVEPNSGVAVQTESLPGRAPDPVNLVRAGSSFAWPSERSGDVAALRTLPAKDGTPGGCAFLSGALFTTSLNGEALLGYPLRATAAGVPVLGTPVLRLQHKYGRLLTVVASPDDGALWLTTSNRDGHGTPIAADERVIRIVPNVGGSSKDDV